LIGRCGGCVVFWGGRVFALARRVVSGGPRGGRKVDSTRPGCERQRTPASAASKRPRPPTPGARGSVEPFRGPRKPAAAALGAPSVDTHGPGDTFRRPSRARRLLSRSASLSVRGWRAREPSAAPPGLVRRVSILIAPTFLRGAPRDGTGAERGRGLPRSTVIPCAAQAAPGPQSRRRSARTARRLTSACYDRRDVAATLSAHG